MMLDSTAPGPPDRLGISFDEAARHVERLGFLDVNGTAPQAAGGANLVVALRDRPTLTHFDPERVEHWVVRDGRGRPAEITRATRRRWTGRSRGARSGSWTGSRSTTRSSPSGERCATVARDPTTMLVVLSSHAPILRSTGHSQGVDLSTGEVGAFFARMMVPIDFDAGSRGPHRGVAADGDLRRLPRVGPGAPQRVGRAPRVAPGVRGLVPPGTTAAGPTCSARTGRPGQTLAAELGLTTP